ncbi:MAG: M23 family metallopeptidase, partial [Bacteroidales bacterium]|nr:M23 family metallopeptidase [Bacteroidales bacterium]
IEEYGDIPRKNNGNFVFIESVLNGIVYTFCYLHLKDVYLVVGDAVSPGQIIGTSGITGNYSQTLSGGSHLHLQIKNGVQSSKKNVDPEFFIYTRFDSEGNSINHCK